MVTAPFVLTLAIFFAVFAVVLALRYHATGRAEPKLTDALLALVPAVLALLVSGYIQRFVVGPDRVEIEVREAFLTAGRSQIAGQVSELPFLPLEEAGKGGFADLERMIAEKVEVLSFVLGSDSYVPEVVRTYFERLGNEGFVRFVLFKDRDGRMRFLCAAQPLIAVVNSEAYAPAGEGPARFVDDLRSGFVTNWLSSASFCVPAERAVAAKAQKGDVLAEMETLDREWLPVKTGEERFAGVVYRSRLTSSVLVDVLRSLHGETARGTLPDTRLAALERTDPAGSMGEGPDPVVVTAEGNGSTRVGRGRDDRRGMAVAGWTNGGSDGQEEWRE